MVIEDTIFTEKSYITSYNALKDGYIRNVEITNT
jgi:hypothetical protein